MASEQEYYDLFARKVKNIKQGSGGEYMGLCPFHNEKKSSFSFNVRLGGVYNCKSGRCNAEGNAVKFAKHFGIDPVPFYSDKYKRTDGKQTGRPPKTEGKQEGKPKLNAEQLQEMAIRYYKKGSWKSDVDSLTAMLEIGIDDNGRLTFPYHNDNGEVVGIKHHKGSKDGQKPYWTLGDGSSKWYLAEYLPNYDKSKPLIICEGEKDAVQLLRKGYNAICGSAGCGSVPKPLPIFKEYPLLYVLYDNDESGELGAERCASKIYKELGIECRIPQWNPALPKGFDVSDDKKWVEVPRAINNYKVLDHAKHDQKPSQGKEYHLVGLLDAFEMNIPKPEMIVEDILNERGNTLLVAEDSVGKSMMANQLGLCIATGTDFLGYKVPKPRKVMLVQHEMENGEQVDRLKQQSKWFQINHPESFSENIKLHLIQEGDNLAITDQFEVLGNTLASNPDIEVVVFDNIGQSTNVKMSDPDLIRNELKRLKDLCRLHGVAFILVAHVVKVDWAKDKDLRKNQIQGGKPVSDWADNIIQLMTSALNTELVLFKMTKVRSVHNKDGITTKNMNQGVWWNRNGDLLFSDRFGMTNWESHFIGAEKYERELELVRAMMEYEQPFTTNDIINQADQLHPPVSASTIKGYWLPKLINGKMGWLTKEKHGMYSVNKKVLDFISADPNPSDV